MSNFKNLKFTNVGLNLKMKCEFEKSLKLLNFKIGDGALNGINPRELEDLINVKMDNIEIISCQKFESQKLEITGYINNENVDVGFYWREIGIFAEDPDTKEEVLMWYGNSEEFSDYIPDKSKQNERYIKLIVAISDELEVKINTPSNIYATQEDMRKLEDNINGSLIPHVQSKVTDENGIHGMRISSKCMIQAQDENGNWFDVANGALSNNEIFKPYTVSNIKALAGKNRVVISWNDPDDKEVIDKKSGDVVTAKWANTKVVMKTGGYPTNLQDGTLIVDNKLKNKYAKSGYEVTGLNNNTTYYFRFFVYSDLDAVNNDENSKINATPTLIKPDSCTNISVKSKNGKAIVYWSDPDDSEKEGEICTWAGTKLVIKKGSYPTSAQDGTLVVDSTVRNQYSTMGYEVTGLENDVVYYGQLFPYSTDDVYNDSIENRLELTPKSVTVYGVQREISSSSTNWTRIEGAEGLNANATKDGSTVVNDFDNIYPWSDIISVDISSDGTINSRYGEPDFSFTNPTGYIMTYFPEFWWKRVQEDGYEKVYIADNEYEDFNHSEPFYIGRYNTSGSSSAVTCKSGVAPFTSVSITNLRTYSKNIGTNWGLMDIWRWSMLQILYLVEYADYNSQDKLGYGDCNGSKINSGGCDSLGMKSGTLNNDKAHAVIYRGVENIFGNIYQWLDGINIGSGPKSWVCKDRKQYSSDKTSSPYVQVGYTEAGSGYISRMGYDSNYSEIQRAIEGSGSSSTYCPDYFSSGSGYSVCVGGDYGDDLYCGLWYASYYSSSFAYSYLGGRLLFIPA